MLIQFDRLKRILENALGGVAPKKEDCVYLLSFHERSLEASLIRSTADAVIRQKSGNAAMIMGQIGVAVSQCTGGCKFCTFAQGHTQLAEQKLTGQALRDKIADLSKRDDLYALYLMCMHEYDLGHFIETVKIARAMVPSTTQLWSNVGDTDKDAFLEMKQAGIEGVYHVCRLGEGTDTSIPPQNRIQTMENALQAGLKLYSCCEPIGPEHSPEQLVENMFIGIDLGCTQHAAMRRVAVPGTPLYPYGQITELRLGQIVAVVALASFKVPNMTYCGVHEPNQIAYVSGANMITAETGANPRDNRADTAMGRGMDMNDCRRMLLDSGYSCLCRGDESRIPLSLASLAE